MNILNKKEFETHITLLGWLRIAYSALLILGGAFVFALLAGFGAATQDAVAYRMFGTIGALVGGLMLVLALPGLVAGIGLLSRAPRSRVLSLVLAAFDLFAFPIGTALGAYTVFVLSQDAAVVAFGECCAAEAARVQAATA
jgi:riboflavin transporter FmnP